MIEEHHIKFEKSARYFLLGNPGKNIKTIWFVLHGYGQLAGEFIKNFEVIKNEENLIIAPEALNKFYLRGFTGKIGATWMTKEDRENEIDDYVNMMETVYTEIETSLDLDKIKINVLGFSQGTHTAVRWLSKTKTIVDNLFLWSGSFPHDCNYKDSFDYWSEINIKIILGNKDRFIDKDKIREETKYFNQQNILTELVMFNGEHEINKTQLLKLSSAL